MFNSSIPNTDSSMQIRALHTDCDCTFAVSGVSSLHNHEKYLLNIAIRKLLQLDKNLKQYIHQLLFIVQRGLLY